MEKCNPIQEVVIHGDHPKNVFNFSYIFELGSFLYNNGLYVFGGWDPMMSQSPPDDKNQFYRFDLSTYFLKLEIVSNFFLETYVWEEIIQKGECPSRRRAHRSVIYKNYM